VANHDEIWREKRRAAELLKVEGWQFFALCGKYKDDGIYEKAVPRFAAEVETMIAKEAGEYLAVFSPSPDQRPPQLETDSGRSEIPKSWEVLIQKFAPKTALQRRHRRAAWDEPSDGSFLRCTVSVA
jgi:hypothetical protein